MRIPRLCAPLLTSLLSLFILPGLQAQTVPTFNVESYPTRTGAGFGVTADLNNDGVPDLIFCCDQSSNVWYQLSDGNGAFLAPVTLGPIYQFGSSIASGDFNKDGRTDIAIPNPSGGITIHYNQGGGIFTAKSYFAGWNPREVVVGDFNHDGNLDIAFLPNKRGSPVAVALGDGMGHFTAPVTVFSTNPQLQLTAYSLVVGDFDGDGNADLAVALQSCFRGGCNPSSVATLYGFGSGKFTSKTFPSSFALERLSSFDVNRDGRSDLTFVTGCTVISCGNSIGALLGTASRTLAQVLIQPQHFDENYLGAADLNGDLKVDLIDSYSSGSTAGALLALATTSSSWNTQIELPVSSNAFFQFLLVKDFNRDRKPDIVLYDGSDGLIQELVNTTPTGNYGSCPYPHTGQGIHVCSPTNSSTTHSPVRVTAAANSFQPIRKMELWIDGHKIKEQFRSWLDFTTPLARGTHKVTVYSVGYDSDFQRKAFTVTVN